MSFRRARAAQEIRRELAAMLHEGLPGRPTPSVYLSEVEIAPDSSFAKVVVLPAVPRTKVDEKDLIDPLQAAEGYLRSELGRRMRLRRIPRLRFVFDRGRQNADRIDELLERAKKRSKSTDAGALLLLLCLWASPAAADRSTGAPAPLERFEASAQIMGSEFRVALYGDKLSRLGPIAHAAFDEARRIDALLSNYKPESELSRLNRSAVEGPVQVSEELFDLLGRSLQYCRESEGAFDPTVGGLMKTWGFYKGSGELPGRWNMRAALDKVGCENLEFDRATTAVRFQQAGLELDPGGFGKGYAVQQVAALIRRYDVRAAMISAGSSSLYAIGAPPGEPRGWKAEIRDPRDPTATAAAVYLRDESMSTSGSYEKFFEAGGQTYSHIMDPRSGMPAQGVASVSILAADPLDSEVWTTALFVNGLDWAEQKAPPQLRIFYCPREQHCRWLAGRAQ